MKTLRFVRPLGLALFALILTPLVLQARIDCTTNLCGLSGGTMTGLRDTFMNTFGTQTVTGAKTFFNDVTLDDGTGASPSFTMTDETDETLVVSKVDSGYATFTTPAADGVQILTGSLKIGNGTPNQTINGEDLYVEGISEFDGAMAVDGTMTVSGTVDITGTFQIGSATVSATAAELDDVTVQIDIADLSTAATYHVVSHFAGNITDWYCVLEDTITGEGAVLTLSVNGQEVTSGGSITVTFVGSATGDVQLVNAITGSTTVAQGQLISIATDGGSTGTVQEMCLLVIDR